jgi:iron complex outermembrane recepter protein
LAAVPAGLATSAESAPHMVTLPAGPLDKALAGLAAETQEQILFDPALLGGRSAPPLHGRYEPGQAIDRLLSGSGLVARRLSAGVLVIEAAPHAARPDPFVRDSAIPPPNIIVTALKRPTRLGNTAVSMDALPGTVLATLGVSSLRAASTLAPSLMLSAVAPLQQRLALRGVSGAGESTVGVYYGETPISGPSGTTFDPGAFTPDIDLIDIERIEVLRGPQGTLYGASSMGGTLRILFAQPDLTRWAAHGETGVDAVEGGGTGGRIQAMVNAPLVPDVLAVRVVGQHRTAGGYIQNAALGLSNLGRVERDAARIAVALVPADAVKLTATALYQDTEIDDSNAWSPALGRYQTAQPVRTPAGGRLQLYNLLLHTDLGFAQLAATASYYRWDIVKETNFTSVLEQQRGDASACRRLADLSADQACTGAQRAAFEAYLDSQLPSILYQPMRVSSRSAEFRLNSTSGSAWEWTTGFFAERRSDAADSYAARADPVTGNLIRPFAVTGLRLVQTELSQQAFFLDVSRRLTDRLTASAGGRYFRYRRSATGSVPVPNILTGTGDLDALRYDRTQSGGNARLSLAYRLADGNLVYGIAAQGFRPGGVNITPGLTAEERSYGADRLWSYEIGFKSRRIGDVARLTAAAYRIDWTNVIFPASSANGAFRYNTNLGKVRINGFEGGIMLEAGRVRAIAQFSFTDARLAADQPALPTGDFGHKGDRLPDIPRFVYSAVIEGEWAAFGRRGTIGANLVGNSGSWTSFNPAMSYFERTSSRRTADFYASLILGRSRVSVSVSNLFDAVAPLRSSASAFATGQIYSTDPRTYSLRWSFDF